MTTPRQQTILDSFDYHRPSPEQGDRIGRVRAAFKRCALAVLACTPEGPDQTAALRQLHESMMTANKSIACEPGGERLDALAAAPGHTPYVVYCCDQHADEHVYEPVLPDVEAPGAPSVLPDPNRSRDALREITRLGQEHQGIDGGLPDR